MLLRTHTTTPNLTCNAPSLPLAAARYFTDDLHGAYMDQHIAFAVFLPHVLPELSMHFSRLEFPLTLIGVRWFLCLFAADMEPECTARLWDVLFSHGVHVLFALALGLLSDHQQRLLNSPDVPELFTAVRGVGKASPSWATLHGLTHRFPSEADVQVARAAYLRLHPAPSSAGGSSCGPGGGESEINHAAGAPTASGAIVRNGDDEEPASRSPEDAGGQVLVAEIIADALAEVSQAEHARSLLSAERRALHEAATTARDLRNFLGGDDALERLRLRIRAEGRSAGGKSERGFWSSAAAFLAPSRLLEGMWGGTGAHSSSRDMKL